MNRLVSAFISSVVLASALVMPVSAASPVPTVDITSVGGQTPALGLVTLNVTALPTTVDLAGIISIDQATLDGVDFTISDTFGATTTVLYSGRYFSGIGNEDSASFLTPWTITGAGEHVITATVTFARNDDMDAVSVMVILNAVTVNHCPAAPSIAAHYLKALGIKPASKIYKNVISLVAGHMGPQTNFDGVMACDPGYAPVVQSYVDLNMSVAK